MSSTFEILSNKLNVLLKLWLQNLIFVEICCSTHKYQYSVKKYWVELVAIRLHPQLIMNSLQKCLLSVPVFLEVLQ